MHKPTRTDPLNAHPNVPICRHIVPACTQGEGENLRIRVE